MTRLARLARVLAALACGLVSAPALACSCWGTTGIGTALTEAKIVVVGRVERRLDPSEGLDSSGNSAISPVYPNPVVVKVLRTLKGDVGEEIRISTDPMCYRSFNLDDLKPGETFVFPINKYLESGVGLLPTCSHSALKLVDGELFTNEPTSNGGRRLAHYMSFTTMRLMLPLGLLDIAVRIALAAAMLLLLPIPITSCVRRRATGAAGTELPPNPIASLQSVNLRTGFVVAWLFLCACVSTFMGFADGALFSRVAGGGLGLAFACAAMGMALRWRWVEGLGYGLALTCVAASLALAYLAMHEFFKYAAQFGYGQTRQLVIFSVVVLVFIAIMIWCADAFRRRFSSKAG